MSKKTKAPSFELKDQTGKKHALKDYKGKWLLLYFYPKDDTPGCTKEACTLSENFSELKKYNARVLGVSADSVESHKKFSGKYKLTFPLLSDEEKNVIKAYKAWGKKKFMGREFMGIKRISYLISPTGYIEKKYDPVKPAFHADEVLKDLKNIKKNL